MGTTNNPTLFLRGVDPHKLLDAYRSGNLEKYSSDKKKIKLATDDKILAPSYGSDSSSPIYCVKDRNGCKVVLTTSGHQNVEVFTKSGGELPVGGRCMRCLKDYDTVRVGYPIAYKEETILMNQTENPMDARYRIIYVFWVEGSFCDFSCALGYVQQVMSRPVEYRDTTLKDSERLLKFLFQLTYPDAGPLRPSQDPLLLISNGGSLTRDEWSDSNHVYRRTDRVLIIPAKVEYVRTNFSSPVSTIDFIQNNSVPNITST